MLATIKHTVDDNFVFQQHKCTSAWCKQHSSTAAAWNYQHHFCQAIAPNSPELNSVDHKI